MTACCLGRMTKLSKDAWSCQLLEERKLLGFPRTGWLAAPGPPSDFIAVCSKGGDTGVGVPLALVSGSGWASSVGGGVRGAIESSLPCGQSVLPGAPHSGRTGIQHGSSRRLPARVRRADSESRVGECIRRCASEAGPDPEESVCYT
jgi:hypothetical protein